MLRSARVKSSRAPQDVRGQPTRRRSCPWVICAPASWRPCAAWSTTLCESPPTKLLRSGADEVGALQVAQLRVAVTAELGDAHAQPPEALRPVLVALLDQRPGGGRPREDENEGGRPGQCSGKRAVCQCVPLQLFEDRGARWARGGLAPT